MSLDVTLQSKLHIFQWRLCLEEVKFSRQHTVIQAQQLNRELQMATSQLDSAQQALRKSKGKSPMKDSQQTATLSALDTLSPTQMSTLSQDDLTGGPAQKKAHYSTQHTVPSTIASPASSIAAAKASMSPNTQVSDQALNQEGVIPWHIAGHCAHSCFCLFASTEKHVRCEWSPYECLHEGILMCVTSQVLVKVQARWNQLRRKGKLRSVSPMQPVQK